MSQQAQQPSLTATYTSPTNPPFQISSPLELSSPPSSSSASSSASPEAPKQKRVAYLSQLRKAASAIQASVNKELTSRMEDDKIRERDGQEEASSSTSNGPASKKKKVKRVVDDEAEEQNYGEEVVEDSD